MVKFFIDPGHGGTDPGAVANGLLEKYLNLAISLKIRSLLLNYENVQVALSRYDDSTLSLLERADMANDWGADYFMSIHINASGGTGFETFVHSNASSASVARQNVIHPEILKKSELQDRGKKRANYAVLRETNMPAILTENGFIDHSNDAAKLKQNSYLDALAEGHVNGLVKAFGLRRKTMNGWIRENGNWYYYVNGVRKTGWTQDKNKWYYLNSSGVMETGWVKVTGKWYFLDASGAMKTGWIQDNGKWYYLNPNGDMATGVIQDKGKLYYLDKNGAMASNTEINVTLHADKNGALRP